MTRTPDAGRDAPFPLATVLVAEDEPTVRDFVTRGLEQAGYQVHAVEDGVLALEALATQSFDILLTDIVMPGLDGIELALTASRDHPDLIILMMTGYAAERQRAYGLENLIHKVLVKPFDLRQLTETVRDALNGGR